MGRGGGRDTAHLAAKAISPIDVEQVFANGGVFVPNKKAGSGDWKMIGPTNGGRLLTIVLVYEELTRTIRAFTGWKPTDNERKHWDG